MRLLVRTCAFEPLQTEAALTGALESAALGSPFGNLRRTLGVCTSNVNNKSVLFGFCNVKMAQLKWTGVFAGTTLRGEQVFGTNGYYEIRTPNPFGWPVANAGRGVHWSAPQK